MNNEKNILRAELRAKRDRLSREYINASSRTACEKITELDEFARADTILLYFPIKNEISPIFLLEVAQKWGKKVAFPVCNYESGELIFKEICRVNELREAKFGLFEPTEECSVIVPDEKALCIVPALAFSEDGNRLGYGKGFYDKFLQSFKGKSVGIIYSELLLPTLPTENHDKKVQAIVTENGIIRVQK